MGSKRTRVSRNLGQRVTPAAIEYFREALPLQDKYFRCTHGGKIICRLKAHCDDCARYLELSCQLQLELLLKPWDTNPLNVDAENPYAEDSSAARSWRAAVKLRMELEKIK